MTLQKNANTEDDPSAPGIVIQTDAAWCRKQGWTTVRRGLWLFLMISLTIVTLAGVGILKVRAAWWEVGGIAALMAVLMAAALRLLYSWSVRVVVIANAHKLWFGSPAIGMRSIGFADIELLKVEHDEKRKCWTVYVSSAPRRTIRIPTEACPILPEQIDYLRGLAAQAAGTESATLEGPSDPTCQ